MTQVSVQILECGGKRLIAGGDLSEFAIAGTWGNVIDGAPGASLATVTFAAGCMDAAMIRLIEPWYHEMRILLDEDVVFEGPIHTFAAPVHRGAEASISAWDVTGWGDIRFVRDQFDWSTGETCSTIIAALTRSAFIGGPAWAGQIPDVNVVPWMNIQPISTVIKRQNGSLIQIVVGPPSAVLTYAQGDRPLTDPHELLWDRYLSALVGNQVHMSTHGRQINFWQYGTSLGRLGTVDVADFIDFPNLVKDGDQTTTGAACQVADVSVTMGDPTTPPVNTYGANIDQSTFEVVSNLANSVSIPFYPGQAVEADSSLTLPIGTEYVSYQWFPGFIGSSDPALDVQLDRKFIANTSVGTNIKGEVFGLAGGKHPEIPLLVERFQSQQNVIGRDQAQQIAGSMLQLTAPYDTLDTDVFKAAITQHMPWEYATLVPGQTVLITSLLGPLILQIATVGGDWASNGDVATLNLHVGLRTVPHAAFVPTAPYVAFLGNDAPTDDGTVITVSLDRSRDRRRRRAGEDIVMAAILVQAPSKPAAVFFPPCTWVPIDSPADATAMLTAIGTYTTANVSDNQWEVWKLAAVTGTA